MKAAAGAPHANKHGVSAAWPRSLSRFTVTSHKRSQCETRKVLHDRTEPHTQEDKTRSHPPAKSLGWPRRSLCLSTLPAHADADGAGGLRGRGAQQSRRLACCVSAYQHAYRAVRPPAAPRRPDRLVADWL